MSRNKFNKIRSDEIWEAYRQNETLSTNWRKHPYTTTFMNDALMVGKAKICGILLSPSYLVHVLVTNRIVVSFF